MNLLKINNNFTLNNNNININTIRFSGNIPVQKVKQLLTPLTNRNLNYRKIGLNSRSACPTSLNLGSDYSTIFKAMIENGTKVFIDVREEGGATSEFKKAIEAFNKTMHKNILTYTNFPVNHDTKSNIIIGTIEDFMKNLGEHIELMNKGGCNVSCGGGQHRTDLFHILSYIFNPKNTEAPLLSKALHINSNLNINIYLKLLKKLKSKLFQNNAKQSFIYTNIPKLRKISGKEFDERVNDIYFRNSQLTHS